MSAFHPLRTFLSHPYLAPFHPGAVTVAARIHINTNQHREVELWLNEEGRDLLVQELRKLGPENEHFHLGPSGQDPEVPLQTVPYRREDEVFAWGKVLFRQDEWDAKHFPHVLQAREGGENPASAPQDFPFKQGMKFFLVEFRRQGANVASVHTFGWDEGDALRRALADFDQFPDGDPRAGGDDLEVRIGRVEAVFPDNWRPLTEIG